MLSKTAMKSCLAGEPTPVVPAFPLWVDGKFWNAYGDELVELVNRYGGNDYVECSPMLGRRYPEQDVGPEELVDVWGSRFGEAPDGVGSHPTVPIVNSMADWEEYRANYIPSVGPEAFCQPIKDVVAGKPDTYVVATFWRTFYERMYMLMDMQEVWIEIASEGEVFLSMLTELRDFTIRGIELIGTTGADAVFLADDWGTQHRLQISPAAWRKHFRPAYAAMIETAHAAGLDVWLHSCGNITEIIPDWIDIGLDVLTHLQATALDLPAIAKAYRGQMTFCGGINVQDILINGDRDAVRADVRGLMENFRAHEGKYIASPSTSIMPETPIANVAAMFEAIHEFGRAG